jgi:hypothetical protein
LVPARYVATLASPLNGKDLSSKYNAAVTILFLWNNYGFILPKAHCPYLPHRIMMLTPHTPPSQNSPMLPPDTVPVARHTSHADYRTGDLKLGRIAVLADLRRYLQVPFDCLVKCVGAGPSQPNLQRIRNNLTKCKILTDDESGLRWTDFTPPAISKESEENAFKPLGRIIAEILAEVPDHGVSFLANPNGTPLSERNNTSRPDGYLVLSNEKPEPKIHWFDIAVPFEFKKGRNIESLRDVSCYRSILSASAHKAYSRTKKK